MVGFAGAGTARVNRIGGHGQLSGFSSFKSSCPESMKLVIASAAKQSSFEGLDCFTAFAMTIRFVARFIERAQRSNLVLMRSAFRLLRSVRNDDPILREVYGKPNKSVTLILKRIHLLAH